VQWKQWTASRIGEGAGDLAIRTQMKDKVERRKEKILNIKIYWLGL